MSPPPVPQEPERTVHLLFDVEQMRPACVLLQAVGDGDRDALMTLFPASTWLVAPTENMRRYAGTWGEWEQIAALSSQEPAP